MTREFARNEKLIQARQQRGLSQEQLAEALGASSLTVGRWERGETSPTLQLRKKVCNYFEMSADDLGFVQTPPVAEAEEPEEPVLSEQDTPPLPPHLPRMSLRFSWRRLLLSGLILGALLLAFIAYQVFRPMPMLSGHLDPTPASVNLTQEGTLDWVHWGYLNSDTGNPSQFIGNPVRIDCHYNPHCLNRKHRRNSFISDYTPIGHFDRSHLPYRLYFKDGPQFSWTDGVPVAIGANARTQEYMAFVGNGFQLQVRADQTVHTLKIYLGIYQGQVACKAILSDHSAPPYTDTTLNTFDLFDTGRAVYYSFTYRAASPGQILTITLTLSADLGGANVSLAAAALQ